MCYRSARRVASPRTRARLQRGGSTFVRARSTVAQPPVLVFTQSLPLKRFFGNSDVLMPRHAILARHLTNVSSSVPLLMRE